MSEQLDNLIDNFFLYFPTENIEGTDFECNENYNPFELIIKYPDGTVKVYDDLNRSIRIVSYNSGNVTDEIWKREFARRVKWRLHRKGYTQEELAAELGINRCTLNGYLTGKNMPGFRFVTKLAKALGCTPNDLYIE